jgi:hypothetical protein
VECNWRKRRRRRKSSEFLSYPMSFIALADRGFFDRDEEGEETEISTEEEVEEEE